MYLVLNKKSPYYQLIYTKDGKLSSASTGTKSKEEAEKFLKHFTPPIGKEKPKTETVIKLSLFFEEYKIYVRDSFSAAYLERAVIPAFNKIIKFLPDLPIENISSRNVDQFISSISAYSKSAASLYHRTLKAAFNKAIAWDYIKANPFNKIKAPKVPKSLPQFIIEQELQLILGKTNSQFLKDIFVTAFYTGMRLGELLNMKWSWVDFSQGIITVKNSSDFKTKSNRERIIPIHPKVANVFRSCFPIGKETDNLFIFFKCQGIKLNNNFVSKQFKKSVREAKLNDSIHIHSLRHSFASALVQRGISLYAVKELLGHGDIKTTQIYAHLQKENLAQAVNLL